MSRPRELAGWKMPVMDAVLALFRRLRPPVKEGYVLAYWSCTENNDDPIFWTGKHRTDPQWCYLGGSAHVYPTYAEAAESGNELDWIRQLPPEGKRVVKIRLHTQVEVLDHYPVDVLDALAEV